MSSDLPDGIQLRMILVRGHGVKNESI